MCKQSFNPFTTDPVKALHFAILVKPTIFNFWHPGALALSPERQSAQMSKIKNGGLDQYGAGLFEQQQFRTAGVEGVNSINYCMQNKITAWPNPTQPNPTHGWTKPTTNQCCATRYSFFWASVSLKVLATPVNCWCTCTCLKQLTREQWKDGTLPRSLSWILMSEPDVCGRIPLLELNCFFAGVYSFLSPTSPDTGDSGCSAGRMTDSFVLTEPRDSLLSEFNFNFSFNLFINKTRISYNIKHASETCGLPGHWRTFYGSPGIKITFGNHIENVKTV